MEDRTTGALNYLPFAAGVAAPPSAAGGAGGPDFLPGFAGRLLPNDPLNIFPFLVFLSPLPMIMFF